MRKYIYLIGDEDFSDCTDHDVYGVFDSAQLAFDVLFSLKEEYGRKDGVVWLQVRPVNIFNKYDSCKLWLFFGSESINEWKAKTLEIIKEYA